MAGDTVAKLAACWNGARPRELGPSVANHHSPFRGPCHSDRHCHRGPLTAAVQRVSQAAHNSSSSKPTALAVEGMRHWRRFRIVLAPYQRLSMWPNGVASAGKPVRQRHSSWAVPIRRENRFVERASALSADRREVQCGPSLPDGQRASSGSPTSPWRRETRRPSGLGAGQRTPEKSGQTVGALKANVAPHSYRCLVRRSEPEPTTNQSGVRNPSAVDGNYATRRRHSLKRGAKPHRAARCRCGAGGSPRLQSWVADRTEIP